MGDFPYVGSSISPFTGYSSKATVARRSAPLRSFTPDDARSLPGAAWLQERRGAAAALAASMSLPTAELEDWRYSPIADLDLDEFQPLLAGGEAPAGMPAGARAVLEQFPDPAGAIVVCNGRIVHRSLDAELAARGVHLGPAEELDDGEDLLLADEPPADVFACLNTAFAPEPLVLRVPRGVEVTRPIVVVSWLHAAGLAAFTNLTVDIGEGATASVVEVQGSDDVRALAVPVTSVRAARGGQLDMVTVQERGLQVWQLATMRATVGQEATVRLAHAAVGGLYARARTECRLVGRGGSGELLAAYFGAGDQTLDFRTFQHHDAPDTTSNLLFTGVVDDRSRSIYTGLIRVGKDARGTNAFQTNRNIKLSDDAWAESVPNLEIEQNDVRCSHASTVGPVDEDQRFYLESRGVLPNFAERLIVAGFFEEVLAKLPVDEARERVRADLLARLDGRER
jgi:Fe-S cluster assembly protein SufD